MVGKEESGKALAILPLMAAFSWERKSHQHPNHSSNVLQHWGVFYDTRSWCLGSKNQAKEILAQARGKEKTLNDIHPTEGSLRLDVVYVFYLSLGLGGRRSFSLQEVECLRGLVFIVCLSSLTLAMIKR